MGQPPASGLVAITKMPESHAFSKFSDHFSPYIPLSARGRGHERRGCCPVAPEGAATVERVRRRCVAEGIEAALGRREQVNRRPKKLDGSGEAHLVALACGAPPEGRADWTLKLLADRLVECEIVESISYETVRQTLKKTNSSLG